MKEAKEILHVMWFGSGLDLINMAIRYGYDYDTSYSRVLKFCDNDEILAYPITRSDMMEFLSRKAYNLL